jgi:FtsH-binding integral membrane protein
MEIIKLSTDWARAEVFSAKMVGLLSAAVFLLALGFWQLGKTPMAKSFVWPLFVAGLLLVAVSAGLYFANKPRIVQFEAAYKNDADAFIKSEIERTMKSKGELAVVFKVLPAIIIAAALLIMFSQAPLWRAIGVTTILLMTLLMLIDSNTDARNTSYHQNLLTAKP